MGVAHVGLVHCDPCKCKVKGFCAVSSIERNVSNRRHLQGVRHLVLEAGFLLTVLASQWENGLYQTRGEGELKSF